MTQEARQCQNCKNSFTIEPEDFAFYNCVKVPAPTFCPECRTVRRMVTNVNYLKMHKRKCDATGKDIISMYPRDVPFKVYERNYWFSDQWDLMDFGKEYDFKKPFFLQFAELRRSIPRYHTFNEKSVNCEYCPAILNSRNCYLTTGQNNEDCAYSSVGNCKNCFDCWLVSDSELCYECLDAKKCYKVFFSQYITGCIDSAFLFNCSYCSNCFGCSNLRNKSYYIFNTPYTKENYFKSLKRFYYLSTFSRFQNLKQNFEEKKLSVPHRFAMIFNSVNVSGDRIRDGKNCIACFETDGVEDSKFIFLSGLNLRDSYDTTDCGTNASLLYEATAVGLNTNRVMFANLVLEGHDMYYSDMCSGCSNLFACVGLRNKQYCILNKQYTKQEYEALVPKIIEQMNTIPYVDARGRVYKYGEFFPPELSQIAYNETIAQELFPLTKEQAIEQGYKWKDPDTKEYQPTKQASDLPDHIKDVPDSIINEVIQCAHTNLWTSGVHRLETKCNHQCTTAFRIIPEELQFYRRMNLPLPRLCPNCRHYERLAQRNPLKLWHRKCMCGGNVSENGVYKNTISHQHGEDHCPNEFETSYSPNRKEIVYCEKCYQAEVV